MHLAAGNILDSTVSYHKESIQVNGQVQVSFLFFSYPLRKLQSRAIFASDFLFVVQVVV
jgi:hypothetical protein